MAQAPWRSSSRRWPGARLSAGRHLAGPPDLTSRLQLHYFLATGLVRTDPFLTAHAAVHGVSAAHRALLAQRRVLFQGPKYLRKAVSQLTELPTGYLDVADALLAAPSLAVKDEFAALVELQLGKVLSIEESLSRYVERNELAWLAGSAPTEHL